MWDYLQQQKVSQEHRNSKQNNSVEMNQADPEGELHHSSRNTSSYQVLSTH